MDMERHTKEALEPDVDNYDLAILTALAADSAITASELSKSVHLSRTAVVRRIRSLEERGYLNGSRADVDYAKLGFVVRASVFVRAPSKGSFELKDLLLERPEVLSLSVVIGDFLMHLDVIAVSTKHLHRFLTWLQESADSETHVVLQRHRSSIPLNERLRRVNDFLALQDERIDKPGEFAPVEWPDRETETRR